MLGSIKEMIPRIARTRDIHHIYIAAHGDEQAIHGAGDARISRKVLGNALAEVHPKQIYGVFFGSCTFGGNVGALMEQTSATWLAGYVEEVDWLHSSAMDLYFWHAYYLSGATGSGPPCSPAHRFRMRYLRRDSFQSA